ALSDRKGLSLFKRYSMANRLFNYLLILILMLISFVIGFNTGKNGNQVEVTSVPEWWNENAANDSVMYFYGTATAQMEEIALQRAENSARRAVLNYISSTIEESMDEVSKENEITVYSPGLTINKLQRNNSLIIRIPEKNKFKAFVQMTIPKEIINKLVDKE
ncbi:MAG: hypothetical protein JXR56_09220, partial [Candidatus Cloacimonetes bacterium]|nr:hypothetical protein [Candidatus Cloacimonadota bacterium]